MQGRIEFLKCQTTSTYTLNFPVSNFY